jgi:DNA polymerase III subunit delta'
MANTDSAPVSTSVPPRNYTQRYFWHEKAWVALTRDLGKLPHALLFHGPEGLGKRAFVWRLTKSLLCDAPGSDAMACGGCRSCRLFDVGNHPDLLSVTPLGDSVSIVVDQIRAVGQFTALRPHTAPRKLVLVEPAEAMNLNAANAFLKVLEEPPSGSSLLLITPRAVRLSATIRSRCALIPFRPPISADAAEWLRSQGAKDSTAKASLRLAGGAPLRALEFANSDDLAVRDDWIEDVVAVKTGNKDPLNCASRWKGNGADRCLDWFQRYVAELIRAKAVDPETHKNRKLLSDLFCYMDVLSEARMLSQGPLDEALLLEDMLIRWSRLRGPLV